jgi:5-methylcytosine-specific restriction enzyme A
MFLSLFRKFEGYFQGRSYSWTKIRKEHLRKNNECFVCRRQMDLDVHHIVPVHVDPSRELDPSNLVTLCGKYCHFIFGHLMDWKSWNENIVKDAIMFREKIQARPKKGEE